MYNVINIDEENTKRVLLWFEIEGNALIGEEEIKGLDLNDLRKIFNVTDIYDPESNISYDEDFDPYMYDRHPVNTEHVEILQPYFEHQIDLNKYEYCISAYTRTT